MGIYFKFPVDPDEERKKEENEPPPPDFPPKLQYFGPPVKGDKEVPEQIRRVFGTDDFVKYKKPVPPLPPPKGSYHKKPLYWQMEGTGYASPINRITLIVLGVCCAVTIGIVKFGKWPQRIDRWLGMEDMNSPEWLAEHNRQREFYSKMFMGLKEETIQFVTYDKVKSKIPAWKEGIRWDIREVDRRVQDIHHMQNLRGSEIKGRFDE